MLLCHKGDAGPLFEYLKRILKEKKTSSHLTHTNTRTYTHTLTRTYILLVVSEIGEHLYASPFHGCIFHLSS